MSSRNVGLQVLQAKVRGFEAAGSTIMRRIRKESGVRRHALRLQKRQLAVHSRLHLLAYCLLRGVPYLQVERCAENNRPDPQRLFEVAQAHNSWCARRGYRGLDVAMVKAWLAGEELGKPFVRPPLAHGKTG